MYRKKAEEGKVQGTEYGPRMREKDEGEHTRFDNLIYGYGYGYSITSMYCSPVSVVRDRRASTVRDIQVGTWAPGAQANGTSRRMAAMLLVG